MPTASNMVAIQTVTVGSGGAANIEFTSIPQTYTDLIIKLSSRTNEADDATWLFVDFNNAGLTKTIRTVRGNGSTTGSFTQAAGALVGYAGGNSATASVFGTWEMLVPRYSNTTENKSACIEWATENNAAGYQGGFVGFIYPSTSAVTSIKLTPNATTFQQHTTATLYGLTSVAQSGTKATGGAIYEDSTYFYHVFGASGTFTPTANITADYLVVAGGGGAGGGDATNNGGGGGAGGLRSTVGATGGGGSLESAISLTNGTAYTITVGAGGTGSANGSDSSIAGSGLSTITAVGGGKGGGPLDGVNPSVGGSGGGGRTYGNQAGAAGTANQGYAGGNGIENDNYPGGGGGGAGAVGQTPANSNAPGGNGGNGVAVSAMATATGTGVSTYYAGGGAAGSKANPGTGGLGGGGNGSTTLNTATAGLANTGGGAGANGATGNKSTVNGGSGIVIVRYAK